MAKKPVVPSREEVTSWNLKQLITEIPKLSRHEDITADQAATLSAKRAVIRLSIGHHRLDLYEDGIAHYRLNNGKARVPSSTDHRKIPLAVDRATVKVQGLGQLPFSRGATAILAPGGHGKTPLLWQFADEFERQGRAVRRIRFGETRGEYMTDYADLLAEMMDALYFGQDVFIDSFKNPVYDLPGGLAAGGVATSLWPTMSDLSAVFDRMGLCLVVLLNPSSDDIKVVTNAVEALKSNTNGILTSSRKGEWSGYYREISGNERRVIEFQASKDKFLYNGVTVLVDEGEQNPVHEGETAIISPAAIHFNNVLASALSKLTQAQS